MLKMKKLLLVGLLGLGLMSPLTSSDVHALTLPTTEGRVLQTYDDKPYYEEGGALYAYRGGVEGQVLAKYIIGMTNYYRPDLLPTWKAKILFEGH